MRLDRILCVTALSLSMVLASEPSARVLKPDSPGSAGMDSNALQRGVDLFKDAVARSEIRGTVLMVGRRGKIVLHEAIGWRHKGYRLPMEKDTLFRMASNTKPVVATAALMLVEEGKLGLHEKVGKYFDSFNNWKSRDITLFHLLTHSAGLRIQPIFFPFEEKDPQPPTLRSAADKFGKAGPEFEPGTTYSYSNPGYNTIGALIEHGSGMPLEQFLKTRIYDPLGMTDTLNHEDPDKLHRMTTVYRGSRTPDGRVEFRQGFTPDDPPDFPIIRASGGMISTALDYAKFLQMYLNGGSYGEKRLLSRDSVKHATTPHIRSGDKASYGLGWSVAEDGVYSHGGSDGTFAWVDPVRDLFGIVFTQSPGGVIPTREFQRLVAEACLEFR